MKRLVIILLPLFLALDSYNQTMPVRHLTTNEGLPSNSVRHIMKDSHGFIWLGTDAGACRFDGKDFTYYNMHDGLPGNRVWSITEGKEDEIWFGCYNAGIARYDGKDFVTYDTAQGLVDNDVREIGYSATLDAVLVATSKGFSILKDGRFINFNEHTPGVERAMLTTDFIEEEGKIRIFNFGSQNYEIDPEDNYSIHPWKTIIPEKFQSTSSISSFPDGSLVQGFDRQGVVRYKDGTMEWYREAGQVFGMAMDDRGDFWVSGWDAGLSTGSGLFRIKEGRLESFDDIIGSHSKKGWKLYYDPTNQMLWYATLDDGIFIIPPGFFNYYGPGWFGLKEMEIKNQLIDHDGHLWIACNEQIIKREGDQVKVYPKKDLLLERINAEPGRSKDKEFLKKVEKDFNAIARIGMDHLDNLFISTSIGLFRYDARLDKFRFERGGGTESFVFDENDTLVTGDYWSTDFWQWVYSGLAWEPLKSYDYQTKDGSQNIVKMVQNGNETWIASMTVGLVMNCDGKNTAFHKKYPEMDTYITDIAVGPDSKIYAGGSSGTVYELQKIDGDYELIRAIDPPNDKYGNSVMWLIFDLKGNLFIGMNKGLNVILARHLLHGPDPNRKFFGVEEGYYSSLSSNPILDREGNILLGTGNGLLRINTSLITSYALSKPIPKVSRISIFDTRENEEIIYPEEPFDELASRMNDLDYFQNQVTFNFRLLDYLGGDRVRYEVVLDNGEQIWKNEGFDNKIIYPALEPGNYHITLSAYHMTTGQVFGPEQLSFKINKPWWRVPLFIFGIIMVMIGLVWSVAYWRIKAIKQQEEEKREISRQIADLEVKALQAQINPHFIFNSITGIQSFILKKDDKTALKYLGDLSYVLRQTLEKSFQQLVTLEEDITYIKRYLQLEQMRYKGLINIKISIDPELNPLQVQIPPMILQPLVENAIRHGILPMMKPGTVHIAFMKKGSFLLCVVEDDGVGRKRAQELSIKKNRKHRSYGLEITRKRLEVIEKSLQKGKSSLEIEDLEDQAGKAKGTRVTMTLPLA